jgi:DNA-binding beta-propeller fold protein YncE
MTPRTLASISAAVLFTSATLIGQAPAQPAAPPRGASGPPEHAKVAPINNLPNPYETVRNFGTLPDGRKWGSVSAVHVDVDGKHIWAADRCGANVCAGSTVDPIVKLDPNGKVVRSFGAGLILWPHGIDVDRQGNVWVVDARSATDAELKKFPDARGKGHTVLKFSPQGKLLMTLGTPGEAGDPPAKFTEPNDVLIAPDGSIFVAEAHNAQFLDQNPANGVGRISKFDRDGKFIKTFGAYGYGAGEFRGPHSLAMDSRGRLFVADRGNRRIQIFDQEGKHLDTWYQFSRISGLYIDRMTRSTRSIRNPTTTTTLAGARACASAARAPARSGTSCPSTCPASRRAWADMARWAKAWPLMRPATSMPVKSARCRG